jgi:predicted transcriptional regulator
MSETKALTVRLADQQARQLKLIAEAADRSVNQEIVEAITRYIAARKTDEQLQKKVQEILEKEQAAFEDLVAAS